MSTAVLRRALDLFSDEQPGESGNKKKKSSDPERSIGTSRKGVKKQQKKLKSKSEQKSKGKKIQCAIDEYNRSRKNSDQTEINLEYYQIMSKLGKTDGKTTQAILENRERRSGKKKIKEEETVQSSVFTERDFEKFEEEYDFFS